MVVLDGDAQGVMRTSADRRRGVWFIPYCALVGVGRRLPFAGVAGTGLVLAASLVAAGVDRHRGELWRADLLGA